MSKAKEILRALKEKNGWIKIGAELPSDLDIDEAIAELEAQEAKSCEGCKLCDQNYCEFLEITIKRNFCCNMHEPKATK